MWVIFTHIAMLANLVRGNVLRCSRLNIVLSSQNALKRFEKPFSCLSRDIGLNGGLKIRKEQGFIVRRKMLFGPKDKRLARLSAMLSLLESS